MFESLGFAAMFGVLGIVLAAVGVRIFDVIDYRVSHAEEIKKGNMAAAVVIASFILGICYIIGRTVGG
jgi:uncharacterized membrane protein YjfL (UPF0719 family)